MLSALRASGLCACGSSVQLAGVGGTGPRAVPRCGGLRVGMASIGTGFGAPRSVDIDLEEDGGGPGGGGGKTELYGPDRASPAEADLRAAGGVTSG